jgi:hypothetical protein
MKFVSNLRQVVGFNKTDRHNVDITEILLKEALNTKTQTIAPDII